MSEKGARFPPGGIPMVPDARGGGLPPGRRRRDAGLWASGRGLHPLPVKRHVAGRWLYAGAFLLFGIVLVRTAWMSDDGFITFRTLDHFVRGDGLRFNPDERVQSYTHPLWLLLLAPAYAVTREAFYGPLGLSIAVTGLAGLVFSRRGVASAGVGAAAILCLLGSKAFVDYATSGLENPLTYLLLALFYVAYGEETPPRRRLVRTVLLASLLALNRMDALLLVLPGVLVAAHAAARSGERWDALAGSALVAASPLLLWLGFSLVYYGTVFPNTAYAKLDTGIAAGELVSQGLAYLAASLRFDPVTPVVIAAGVLAAFLRRRAGLAPLALGVVLHLAYTVRIGGDFMLGRHLAAPFFASLMLLFRLRLPPRAYGALAAAILSVSLVYPTAPLRSGRDLHDRDLDRIIRNRGIADERAFYYRSQGLLSPARETPFRIAPACGPDDPRLVVRRGCSALGITGLRTCRGSHVVDPCGLADPLLARLPAAPTPRWRVGHPLRRLPTGYVESLRRRANLVEDPAIRDLYADVREATRGALLSRRRWAAIWRLHFHDYGI
jgi:arabinofuranosyltransferase